MFAPVGRGCKEIDHRNCGRIRARLKEVRSGDDAHAVTQKNNLLVFLKDSIVIQIVAHPACEFIDIFSGSTFWRVEAMHINVGI